MEATDEEGDMMLDVFSSEQQVETMVAAGRRIVDAAIAHYKPVAIIAAFSGGDDSIVTTHFGATHYDALVVHCDTSIGLPITRSHVDSCASRNGWSIRIARAQPEGKPGPLDEGSLPSGRWVDGATAYEEFVLNYGFPGTQQHARMYQRLKQRPLAGIQRELKANAIRNAAILILSGIRADESAVRAGYKRDTQKEPGSSRVWVNPFYWHTKADFEAYRQEFSLPCNPVKARIGVSGECNCGSFAGNAEKDAIRSVDPMFAAYLDELESRARSNGHPWGWGQDPPRWWLQYRRGQGFLFDSHSEDFQPMCVGCQLRRKHQ